jgi:hypothetical protein
MGLTMNKCACALLLGLALSACATAADETAGWTPAANATPFEAAAKECQNRTQSEQGPGSEECMAGLGWTPERHS